MNKVICIYPFDKSTTFLLPIYKVLSSVSKFKGLAFDTTNENCKKIIYSEIESSTENDLIIFLGHGCSLGLYGSPKNGELELIFDNKNSLLNNKKLLLLSCRSSEFMESLISHSIGFGNIPTDYQEICEDEIIGCSNFSFSINQTMIEQYKKSLVQSMCKTIQYINWESFCLNNLYNLIKLFINKEIQAVLENYQISERRFIADMLYDLKTNMRLQYKN